MDIYGYIDGKIISIETGLTAHNNRTNQYAVQLIRFSSFISSICCGASNHIFNGRFIVSWISQLWYKIYLLCSYFNIFNRRFIYSQVKIKNSIITFCTKQISSWLDSYRNTFAYFFLVNFSHLDCSFLFLS